MHLATNCYTIGRFKDILPANRASMEYLVLLILEALSLHIEPFLEAAFVEFVALQQIVQKEDAVFLVYLRNLVLLILEVKLHIVLVHDLLGPAAQRTYHGLSHFHFIETNGARQVLHLFVLFEQLFIFFLSHLYFFELSTSRLLLHHLVCFANSLGIAFKVFEYIQLIHVDNLLLSHK
jgi:hypothetical protein